MSTPSNQEFDRVRLRELLHAHFDLEELHVLCFELGIPYEDLPGRTRASKTADLIAYCERMGRIPDLLSACRHARGQVDWSAVNVASRYSAPLDRAPRALEEPQDPYGSTRGIENEGQGAHGVMWLDGIMFVVAITSFAILVTLILRALLDLYIDYALTVGLLAWFIAAALLWSPFRRRIPHVYLPLLLVATLTVLLGTVVYATLELVYGDTLLGLFALLVLGGTTFVFWNHIRGNL